MLILYAIIVAMFSFVFFFFQAEDGIRDLTVTGVQTCALPILVRRQRRCPAAPRCPRPARACGPSPLPPRRRAARAPPRAPDRASCAPGPARPARPGRSGPPQVPPPPGARPRSAPARGGRAPCAVEDHGSSTADYWQWVFSHVRGPP